MTENKNDDNLKKIADIITKQQKILLFPHIRPDGDAVGSCAALCHVLRTQGKSCHVISDSIPDNLKFMDNGYFLSYKEGKLLNSEGNDSISIESFQPYISICIDLSDLSRLEERKEIFDLGETGIILDHHVTGGKKADYQYVDTAASACGEIIFRLIGEMDAEIDSETGEALFAAITTDTGNFQYSNTTKETHEIVMHLYDSGIDANKVSVAIYENEKPEKIAVSSHVLNNIDVFADGKAVIGVVTREALRQYHATMNDTEGVVQTLRSIAGIEISALLKERGPKEIGVSMRVKRDGDVEKIASRHGGGGHVKAAGCTLYCTMDEAVEIIKKEITEEIKNC